MRHVCALLLVWNEYTSPATNGRYGRGAGRCCPLDARFEARDPSMGIATHSRLKEMPPTDFGLRNWIRRTPDVSAATNTRPKVTSCRISMDFARGVQGTEDYIYLCLLPHLPHGVQAKAFHHLISRPPILCSAPPTPRSPTFGRITVRYTQRRRTIRITLRRRRKTTPELS